MTFILRATLALALLLPVAVASAADRVEAGKLLDAMHMQQAMDQTIEMMLDAQLQSNPKLAAHRKTLSAFFRKYMSYAALRPDMVKAYEEAFTEQELAELRAFYATPTGQKAISVLPGLITKGGEIGQRHVRDHLDDLRKMLAGDGVVDAPAAEPAGK
jgi:hypothetical protein